MMKLLGRILVKHDKFWLFRLLTLKAIILILLSIPLQVLLLPKFSALYVIYAIVGIFTCDMLMFRHCYERDKYYLIFVLSVMLICTALATFSFNNILLLFMAVILIYIFINNAFKNVNNIYIISTIAIIISLFSQTIFLLHDIYQGINFSLYFFMIASGIFWFDKLFTKLYYKIWVASSHAYLGQLINMLEYNEIYYFGSYVIRQRLQLIKNPKYLEFATSFSNAIIEYNYFIHWLKKENIATSNDVSNISDEISNLQYAIIDNHVAFLVIPRDREDHMNIHYALINTMIENWNKLCEFQNK